MALSFRTHWRRKRGFTLIEILVVSAIAAVLVVAAAGLLVTMSTQRSANRKRLDRLTQSFTAMTLLERNMLNAGYHFPSARFGIRIYDDVTTGATTYGGLAVGGGCGGEGCIPEHTDVLELVEGVIPQPGAFDLMTDGGGYQARPRAPGGPLYPADAGTGEFLVLFGGPDGGNCAGRANIVPSPSGPYGILNVMMVNRSLAAQATSYYSATNGTTHAFDCPLQADMSVSVAASRALYLVLVADGGTRGLYRKEINVLSTATTASGDGGLTLLARGIDNFQVMPIIRQVGTSFTTGCSNGLCECNTGLSCSITAADNDTEFALSGNIVGVKVGLSSRGDTDDRVTAPAAAPPRLANETMPADQVKRTTQVQTYMLRNFAQVSP